MFKATRFGLLFVSFTLIAMLATNYEAYAQGFRINSSNNKDKDENNSNNNQFGGRRSNNSNNNKNNNSNNSNSNNEKNKQSNQQKVEQLLQGGGNNPNKNQPFNNNNGPQGQQFKKGGQGQNDPNVQVFGGNNNNNNQPFNKNWQQNKWNGSNSIKSWSKQYNNGPQPFTAKWYDDHSNAWHYNHPHSDVWVVATVPGVYSWLGWGDYPRNNNNVVYDNTPFDPSIYGDWYPVGVYSLITGPYDSGTRIFQISFDRQGNVAGTYYDMVSDSTRKISGRVRRSTQQVDWSVNTNGALTFRTSVDQLFQPQGIVTVDTPGGEQQWQLVRMQNTND